MTPIEWEDRMSVGIAEIDNQHKQLIDFINDLNRAMQEGESRAALGKIINGMFEYAQTHFQTEEEYFTKYEYPEKEAHVELHGQFIRKVFEFIQGYDEKRVDLSEEVLNFLSNWLVSHILGCDLKFRKHIKSYGG